MRPMYDMLTRAAGRCGFHMPGHKGVAPFGSVDFYALDTTELPLTDDLYCAESGIQTAQALYAEAAGAGDTVFLHNGSTAGIHAMMQLYAGEGERVLLPRNAHLSAVNGCVLGGVDAVWMPVRQTEDGYCYVAEEIVLDALDRHPDVKAVLLTRPDFYGGCLPLRRIADKAHSMGIRVVVDEAHGAHFPWLTGMESAGALGADAWVQSVHKTLPGLTGAAVLHVKDAGERLDVMRILRREQTSSPSFLLMMSVDDSRAYMEACGRESLTRIAQAANAVRKALPEGYRDAHAGWSGLGLTFDATRLVIEAPQGGFRLASQLSDVGVDVEMADDARVVLILTVMDDEEKILRLPKVLRGIPPQKRDDALRLQPWTLPPKVMSLRSAVMGKCESVPAAEAAGRIAAASAGLYPPGIPLVCPGELISDEVAALLAKAAPRSRFGMEGEKLLCVR